MRNTTLPSLRHPIVQGPFGGGLSSVALAATVSNLGGLGSYGAHMLAPREVERVTRDLAAATSAPFAVNLWISDHDPGGEAMTEAAYERARRVLSPYFEELGVPFPSFANEAHPSYVEQVDALLEARPPVFSFVFGIPDRRVLDACRARGIATIGAATSIAEAEALDAAGVDAIVATGFEAGGHRPSFLARAEDALMGTFVLTQLVSRRVKKPVFAAGGIADARGVRAARALGATGVQVGTAFLATRESGTTDLHREALFDPARNARTALTRAFTGRLARGIANRWVEEITPKTPALPPFPLLDWFVSKLRAPALERERTDLISLWCGQIAPNLVHRSAPELMQSLIEGVET